MSRVKFFFGFASVFALPHLRTGPELTKGFASQLLASRQCTAPTDALDFRAPPAAQVFACPPTSKGARSVRPARQDR
jgi:hypothetical protein